MQPAREEHMLQGFRCTLRSRLGLGIRSSFPTCEGEGAGVGAGAGEGEGEGEGEVRLR